MSVNRDNSEKALLQQVIAGDQNGFVGIYEIYNRMVYNFIIRYVNSVPMAEDLTQEVFMKIWESRLSLAGVKSFKAYLFTTARNHTLNNLKIVFRSEAAIGEVISGFVKLRNATEEDILHKDYALFLRKMLDGLPPRSREIFKLCREEEKTYDEVARSLNISRNAVKNHMVHSMKVLGSSIQKEFGISLSIIIALLYSYRG
ncbi:RNA polymerase sigma factor [Pedobacter hartonius]|uniref:RNA polymerase sigma-70 factor, ECF subfamily n=1 Tax=Pedobacter hartonius TaxID=425514 RepID=A0A1H4EXZ8_9SPHI|nr:RNA polymerase sigma-70 factor [Pedobacter hartonius]SEA89885.1 RNA polymerase sigma-70 factor, ECF subfamily [Pedobacter hartonius]